MHFNSYIFIFNISLFDILLRDSRFFKLFQFLFLCLLLFLYFYGFNAFHLFSMTGRSTFNYEMDYLLSIL